MSIHKLRLEIQELKSSIISQHEPRYKVFIMGTTDSHTEADIEAYRNSHPYTQVITLTRRSCKT
jgi:hypothetical protein